MRSAGPLNDWKNAVGLGPWILTNFVDGNAMNFDKNPNYWGYDERYHKNKLPYADKLTVAVIQDNTTALAALRTGKIDIMEDVQWQQASNAAKTNPELLQVQLPTSGYGMLLNLNNAPFNDINVRKAMQLAINRPLIAKTHYGGIVDGTPCSRISPALKGYAFTYDEWPQELKDEYSYNPTKAKEILAAAGYPQGFKATCQTVNTYDLELLQIIQSEFKDIGIDMAINTMEMGSYTQFIMTAKHEMAGPEPNGYGTISMPWQSLLGLTSLFINPSTVKDPVYDQMCLNLESIVDPTELAQKIKEGDRYVAEHHWSIWLFPIVTYNIYQPYLKGYSGEQLNYMGYYARWWTDQNQKKTMGR
jgi:peptide/nickel transport system substrate-binding protein